MAFPFDPNLPALRRSLMRAIGAGGALALGGGACQSADQMPLDEGTMNTGERDASVAMSPDPMPPVEVPPTVPMPDPTTIPGGTCQGPGNDVCYTPDEMWAMGKRGCGMILPDPPLTDAEIQAKFLDNGCLAQPHACDSCCNAPVTEGTPQDDGSCCYTYCSNGCCGRPFIVDGLAQAAAATERGDWLGLAGEPLAPYAHLVQRRIAEAWLRDALMEHASIASFARFTLDLLAHGAPPDLLAGAQQAAMDEVEHARLCFGLAARFGLASKGPGPLSTASAAQPQTTLESAAVAALVEGCIGETLAGAEAEAALSVAVDPATRQALTRIARDEQRHAELAYAFVSWAVGQAGPGMVSNIQRAAAEALANVPEVATEAEQEPAEVRRALHDAGRLTQHERCQLRARTVEEVLRPCLDALTSAAVAA